ncbi:hypothetical protein KFU94_31495 [Chloroflexi bacterium TSY]|nr:hypothetical protein [Chloroflexi bacterium TSY]
MGTIMGIIFVTSIIQFVNSTLNETPDPEHLYSVRYEAARWLTKNSSPETIFAAWNAGQLGYFSDRTVINLNGLINSIDYYEEVLSGNKELLDYLQEQGVHYIVDYEDNPLTRSLPIVHEFPQAGKRWLKIWQVPVAEK